MEFHELADVFPKMSESELDALADDIAQNGLREPIWLHRDGRILDGRNRWLACERAGVECATRTFEGGDDELVAFVVSANLSRRHLTTGQRSAIAAELVNLSVGRPGEKTPSIDGISRRAAAASLGVGTASLDRAEYVRKHGSPNVFEALRSGEVSTNAADQAVRTAPKSEQETWSPADIKAAAKAPAKPETKPKEKPVAKKNTKNPRPKSTLSSASCYM